MNMTRAANFPWSPPTTWNSASTNALSSNGGMISRGASAACSRGPASCERRPLHNVVPQAAQLRWRARGL